MSMNSNQYINNVNSILSKYSQEFEESLLIRDKNKLLIICNNINNEIKEISND